MTPALHTLEGQARHYAVIRARLWPCRRVVIPAPFRRWTRPTVTQVFASTDDRIAAILVELRGKRVTTAAVILKTAAVYAVPPRILTGRSRCKNFSEPRQIAMAIASHLLASSAKGTFFALGDVFRRDHTTVLYAVHKHRDAVKAVAEGIR